MARRNYTAGEIASFPTGTHIEGFSGRIRKVYDWKSGTSAHGEWSLQNIDMEDLGGNRIPVTLDKRDELSKDWEGVDVVFHGFHGDKGWQGLIVEDNTYKNKTTRRLRITKSGDMYQAGDEPPGEYNDAPPAQGGNNQRQQAPRQSAPPQQQRGQAPRQQQQPQGNQRQQPPQRQQQAPTGQGQSEGVGAAVMKVKKLLAQLCTLRTMCYDASVARAHQTYETHGHKTSAEGIGAESSALFIETVRRLDRQDIEALPYNLYETHPYKGIPLSVLYDHDKKPPFPLDKSPEEIKAMEAEARQQQQPQQQRPAPYARGYNRDPEPEQRPPAQTNQQPADGELEEGWEANDDIPF